MFIFFTKTLSHNLQHRDPSELLCKKVVYLFLNFMQQLAKGFLCFFAETTPISGDIC